MKANAKGGALGGLAGGAAVANITIDGSAGATVAGSTIGAATGSLVRDLVVQARFSADATADTTPVSGAISAGVGNVAVVTLNLTVSAIAEASMATASLALPVIDCRRRVHSDRPRDWRRPRLWRVRMGVNNVTATTTATNDSLLQNGISVSARNVSVIAHSSHVADASGQANAGGSLIGVMSATSTATDTTMTLAQILKTQPVTASGNVSVSAINDKSDAIAIARGINAVGLAVGVSTASATATPQVLAGVTDASITAGGDVSITAKFGSTGMPGSSVEAYGSNGISPVGTTLTATTTATETVRVIARSQISTRQAE